MDEKQQNNIALIKDIQAVQIQQNSEYYDEYTKFFLNFPEQIEKEASLRSSLEQQLKRHNIFKKNDVHQSFSLVIIFCSPNYEVVEIEINWGCYMLKAEILNIEEQSIFHTCKSSSGANAKIYHLPFNQNNFSVKCIKTKSQENQAISILRIKAFKEYFIFRFASALGVGPMLSKKFIGFDIILSEDCIQFAMETCQKINSLSEQAQLSLKRALFILHIMKIVHFDLKPQNIMWSSSLKHEIFIDFGLSQIVKGGPGYKYPTKFKGSPNYCSFQMTKIMISQEGGYVDIYYNDVFCLNQSIRVFKADFSKKMQTDGGSFAQRAIDLPRYQDYYQEYIDKYQYSNIIRKRWLKIALLKILIYSKNSQKINQIFQESEYKSLLFEREILDFIRTNSPTFYLKEFYEKYVPDSIKQSIEIGWIDDWAKSVYPKSATLQQNYSSQSSSFLPMYLKIKEISTLQANYLDSLTRLELEELLSKDKIDDLQAYFYCFQSYISFLNNIHKVRAEEKIRCCQFFIKLMIPQLKLPSSTQFKAIQQYLLECLIHICKFIFKYFINNKSNNKTVLDNSKRLKLMLNLLEHLHFFTLLQTKEVINLLNQIYALGLWSHLEKFHIILATINHNCWNLVPLFSEKSINSQMIELWFRDKLIELAKECQPSLCRFIQGSFERSPKNWINICQDNRFKQLPSELKMQYMLTQLPKQLVILKQYPISEISKLISENLPSSQKNRLLNIHFYFFAFFNLGYGNIKQSESICELFKKNLLSQYLLEKLIFVRISRIQLIPTIEGRVKQIVHFTKIISRQNAGFLIQVLGRQIIDLSKKCIYIPLQTFKASLGGNKLLKELQLLAKKLHFKQASSEGIHIRQNLDHNCVFFYFTLKWNTYIMNRIRYKSIGRDLQQLQQFIEQTTCRKCQSQLTFQLHRLRIQEIMVNSDQNPVQSLIKSLQTYLDFSKKAQQFEGKYSHSIIYVSVIGKLLLLKCCDQRLFNIIHQYYKYSKKNEVLVNYMDNIQMPKFVSYTLVALLQLESFQEIIYFLNATFRYLHYTESTFTLYPMIDNYMSFFLNPRIRNSPEFINKILSTVHRQFGKERYIAAFYYSYIKIAQQPQEIYQYLKKICLLINNMPLKILFYFQALVYFFIAQEQSQVCKTILSIAASENQGKELRKMKRMNSKLTKLLYSNQNDHYNVQIIQPKIPKIRCRKMRILLNTCRKIGAFTFTDHPSRIIQLKIRMR